MNWETVIGLEVHVQLATKSKIFSGSSTAFGAEPNRQASVIDLGMPGTLPVLNQEALSLAVRFGLAIGARINHRSAFDRKNYFYPDLPKGYQISQFGEPIVGAGELTIRTADGGSRVVGITRAHLEEDAGKSLHEDYDGMTGIDLNRAGTPLLEIVSEPDLRTAAEAADYFRQLHSLVRYLGICDGDLSQGSMRCDANVSIRPAGSSELGERTEIKNINSFRFVERAVNVEVARQIDVLESGGRIHQETRLYDPDRDETRSMRSKEDSQDYRYFPDPDLLPVIIDDAYVEAIRADLPELPEAKQARYVDELGLSAYDAGLLTDDPDIARYFEAVVDAGGQPKPAANWVMGELSAALNRDDVGIRSCPVQPQQLAALLARLDDETLSGKLAKTVFEALWQQEGSVDDIIESRGLKQVSDGGQLQALVDQVITENPGQVEQFLAGKDKVLGFFVGQIMKATGGKANPKQINDLLRKALARD